MNPKRLNKINALARQNLEKSGKIATPRNKYEVADNKDREAATIGGHNVERNPEQVSRRLKLLDMEDDTLP